MSRTEEFKVSGEGVLTKIKELINEGNIRKITIKSKPSLTPNGLKEGKVIAEFPLTLGVIGTALLPTLAAIGTIVALVTECTIAVEREEKEEEMSDEVETPVKRSSESD